MRILILADIHFHDANFDGGDDKHGHVRDAFFKAVEGLKAGGPIDLCLVAGDLAQRGKEAEYAIAAGFLDRVRACLGQTNLEVVTAPGNHDFDRDFLKSNPVLAYVHSTAKPSLQRGQASTAAAFDSWMRSAEARNTILAPFAAYAKFAATLGEQVDPATGAAKPRLIRISDGVDLRIFPISSAVMASSDSDRGTLIVEPAYHAVRREKNGVVNLVLMHHPPAWAVNNSDVAQKLRLLADIAIVGHEHMPQSFTIGDRLLWIDAGSLQPPTQERATPHFAVLEIAGTPRDESVDIEAKLFVHRYREGEYRFVVERDESGGPTCTHLLSVTPSHPVAKTEPPKETVGSNPLGSPQLDPLAIRARFFSLVRSERDVACDGLGVAITADGEADEYAAQRQWAEIQKRELIAGLDEIMTRLAQSRGA